MKEEKRKFSPPVVGGSSLLVIFAVLCLTIFALLSLSTVQADDRLGDAAAEAITGYYQADVQAEAILARLRGGEVPAGVTVTEVPEKPGTVLAAYACPISETQELQVEVSLTGDQYEILRWQAVSTADWRPDEGLNVWSGEHVI